MNPSIKVLVAPLVFMFYTPHATHSSFTKLKQMVCETHFSYLHFTGVRIDTKINKWLFQGPEKSLSLSQEIYIFEISIQCDNNQELIFIII